MVAVDSIIFIYYAHFIEDFTLTITKSSGVSRTYTKDDATLNEDDDCYEINYMNYGSETFTIEGEGFIRREGELGGNADIDIYLQPSKLYAYKVDGYSSSYGYLASLPPVVNKSLLYNDAGTFEGELGGGYIYGERLTAVSGDQITVNAYIEPV